MARKNYLFTSESVSEGHPDKVCDRISDEVVDLFFSRGAEAGIDPYQIRVACETLATTTGAHIRLDDYNHVQLIVKETGLAVYVNEIPTLNVDDPMHADANTLGYFSLNVCNAGTSPLDTKWDNFRVWDISGLP